MGVACTGSCDGSTFGWWLALTLVASSVLASNIERLADYTASHPELRAAHHFLYDLRCPPKGQPKFVVMGINPGETPNDWLLSPTPTEETSRYDFHVEAGPGRSAIRWSKAAQFFLDGADYVLAEIFFWSSRDGRHFRERFGELKSSPHLPMCTAMNKDLIEAYAPRAVIVPGIGSARLCQSLYGVNHLGGLASTKGRLVEHFTDGRRPWIFTKHWTGSFGLSNEQRVQIRDYIRATTKAESESG
ncbi:MAG: hypothetical protein K1X67_22150 [Fimbriimonadaceae bacterium]|nr:hypothetical protein [Fimbriimonadaceae bacterium]